MALIVSFSGSHGVGKTSLINKLEEHIKETKRVKIFKEFNTGLFNMGFPLNGVSSTEDNMFSQKQAFFLGYNTIKHYYESNSFDVIFMDRSCVDTYLYTLFFLRNIDHNYDAELKDMREKSIEVCSLVKHILVPPFADFNEEDRMSLASRNEIWKMFINFFGKEAQTLVSDNTDARFKEVLSSLFSQAVTGSKRVAEAS